MKRLVLVTALSLIPTINSLAADIAAGEKKAAVCIACHGKDGHSSIKTYPNLAGQHADYLVDALKGYRDGARNNPIMVPMAKALSDEDMQNIAAYFAQMK
jgi:cytochrome c553